MNSNTDLILLIVVIIAIFRGWRTGIMRTLIAPGSCFIATIFGIIYFDLNENIVKTVFIICIATIIISVVANTSFSLARRTLSEKQRSYVFLGSRILGLLMNTAWQVCVFSLVVVFLSILPGTITGAVRIQNDIKKSFSYSYIYIYIVDRIPVLKNVISTVEVLSDPVAIKYVEDTREYQSFIEHEKIQDLLMDSKTMEQVYTKDIAALLGNPKIHAVFDDTDLMIKFTKMSKKIYEERSLIQPTDEDFPYEETEPAEEKQ